MISSLSWVASMTRIIRSLVHKTNAIPPLDSIGAHTLHCRPSGRSRRAIHPNFSPRDSTAFRSYVWITGEATMRIRGIVRDATYEENRPG